jgi:RNA polymerase sigma-70 factor (ECF subfamily)
MTDGSRERVADAAEWPGAVASCDTTPGRRQDPDADILQLIRIGDRSDALKRLMTRHGDAVYRYCRNALADRSLAEDVHQQIFIEAYRDLHTFKPRATIRTWLFAITRHRVLDAAKARRRAREYLAEPDDAPDPVTELSPDSQLDIARLRQALEVVVANLPEHTRTTLVLRFQHDFTYEQLAHIVGEAPGTLQRRVARALPVVRTALIRAGFYAVP